MRNDKNLGPNDYMISKRQTMNDAELNHEEGWQ